MGNITVTLSDDVIEQLKERARGLGISPEELVRVSIDELLSQSDEAFEQASEYLLNKNEELYRRLA